MKKRTVQITLLAVFGTLLLLSGGALLFQDEIESQILNKELETNYAVIYKYENEGPTTKLYLNNYESGEPKYETLEFPTYLLNSNIVLDSDLPAETSIEIKNFRYHLDRYEYSKDFLGSILSQVEDLQANTEQIFSDEIMYYKLALAEIYMKAEEQEIKDKAKSMFPYYTLPDSDNIQSDAFTYSINRPFACLIQKEIEKSGITDKEIYSELCNIPDLRISETKPTDAEIVEVNEDISQSEDIDTYYKESGITEAEEGVRTLSSTYLLDSVIAEKEDLESIHAIELLQTKVRDLTPDNFCYWMMVGRDTEFSNDLLSNVLSNKEDLDILNEIYCTGLHGSDHLEFISNPRFKDLAFSAYEYEN